MQTAECPVDGELYIPKSTLRAIFFFSENDSASGHRIEWYLNTFEMDSKSSLMAPTEEVSHADNREEKLEVKRPVSYYETPVAACTFPASVSGLSPDILK